MLVTFATIGLIVWLIVCGIFLGLIPDALQPESALDASATVREAREQAPALAAALHHPVPVELLVYRLEDYIRAEEAAAETYLLEPSTRTLHASTRNMTVN